MPNRPAIPLVNPRLDKTLPEHEHAARRARAQVIKGLPAIPRPTRQPPATDSGSTAFGGDPKSEEATRAK